MRKLLFATLLAGCTDTGLYENVPYDVRFGDATTMDIHTPARRSENRPAIMLIHGGAWSHGSKEAYTEAAERYAAAGYVAATINYRLVPSGTYPAAVQDCLCALSFLRAQRDVYGIDPDRIAVSGYSAGAHLTALISLTTDADTHQPDCAWGPTEQPAAAIPGDGIYNFTEDDSFVIGDFMGDDPENYHRASPLQHVHAGAPPFLIIHGDNDLVPIENGSQLTAALRAAGASARMLELGGAGHVHSAVTPTDASYLQAATDTPEAWAVTFDFLAQTIGAP